MGRICKGTIGSITGNTARIVPSDASAKPTAKAIIPWHLLGDTGQLKKGTLVIYAEFEDSTGLILGRADGGWGEYLPHLEVTNHEADRVRVTGGVTAATVNTTGDVVAGEISLQTHTHPHPYGSTSGPV